MLPHRGEERELAALKDRVKERDIVEVRAAAVESVHGYESARRTVIAEGGMRCPHMPRERDDVTANVLRLCDDFSRRAEQAAGKILGFPDGDRASGAENGRTHLAHD